MALDEANAPTVGALDASAVDIERAVASLPPRMRLAVDCFYFVGLTTAETAVVMHVSEGTVKSTLSDARREVPRAPRGGIVIDIETELQQAGERWRARQPDARVDVERATTSRRRARPLVAATALVVVVVLVAVAFATRSSNPARVHVVTEPSSSTTTAPASQPKSVIALDGKIIQVQALAAADGKLWVTGDAPKSGPAHVQEIDALTGAVLGDTTLPDNGPIAIAIGSGAVWVRAQQGEQSTALFKIDPTTHKVVGTLVMKKDGGLALTPDAVWVNDDVGLERVDPTTVKVTNTIPLVGAGPYTSLLVTSGPIGVWTGNFYTGDVQQIDTSHNTAGPVHHLATDTSTMVELGSSLWVEKYPDQLIEVGPDGRARRTLHMGEPVQGMATDGRALWLATNGSHVLQVDPASGAITRLELPARTALAPTLTADPVRGTIWVAALEPTPRLVSVSPGGGG